MPLYEKREERVDLVEGVEDAEEVARLAMCREGEEVAEGRGKEGGELLFGEELWMQRLDGAC